jgi:hypothetical protein
MAYVNVGKENSGNHYYNDWGQGLRTPKVFASDKMRGFARHGGQAE